ncbi:MAG: hypothetical protein ACKOW2_08885 [Sphingobacteriaceae bacterium]
MLTYTDLHPAKGAFIFEFDGVLYPEKDYFLQIYYLFANFIEYVETVPPAADLLELMKKVYEHHGPEEVFKRAQEAFGLATKYRENFDRLHDSAQFPLKLDLYPEMRTLLEAIIADENPVFLWLKGKAEAELNKIRQVDWGGLAQHLRVYFAEEFSEMPEAEALQLVLKQNDCLAEETLFIGKFAQEGGKYAELDFLSFSDFLSHS